MKRDPKNILHDWKAVRMERSYLSQVEFLGSAIRVSFLRAWLITVIKVMLIFSFMNFHVDVAAKMEENVLLLDKLVHNDFQIDLSHMKVAKVRMIGPKMSEAVAIADIATSTNESIAVENSISKIIQPRGPSPIVAGESTSTPN